jgi:hypothetical protein
MPKKFFINLIIIFSCLLIPASFGVIAQEESAPPPTLQYNLTTISSISENMFFGGIIFVEGKSVPDAKIILSVKDKNDTFIYSAIINSDQNGNWSAELDQPLKKDKYYVEAITQDDSGISTAPVRSDLIDVQGPFAFIIGIFSVLVIILLFSFVSILYINKAAEIKRYRRILACQRDIIASYNILKSDVDRAKKDLNDGKIGEQKINEMKFFLNRVSDNLEKMNKYVVQGVNVIGKYDIINKINDIFKTKK